MRLTHRLTLAMRTLTLALAVLLAGPSSAQIEPVPDLLVIGIPLFAEVGSLELGPDITARGVSSPVPGFVFLDLDDYDGVTGYNIIDVSGGMAVVACFAIPCRGVPEQVNGVDSDTDWVFLDGVLLPRFDSGVLLQTPLGGLGGGVHLSASGAAKDGESFGWVDYGLGLAHGAKVGPVVAMTRASYNWGFEGGSQANTGRSVKVRADLMVPRDGLDLIGFVSFDRHTDTRSTDDEADDFLSTFLTFGAGIGF